MKTTSIIEYKINRLPKGYVFTYTTFLTEVSSKEAIIKSLTRLVKKGKIAKLSKGKFYKPESTPFGEILPSQQEIVKDLLTSEGKPIGYLTGLSIFSQLKLTTQIGYTIQIGRNDFRPTFNRGPFTITFVIQKNIITKENIPLLQILDAIKLVKKIPDTPVSTAIKRLIALIKDLNTKEIPAIIRLSMKYPPSTRALLGAMLDEIYEEDISQPLLETLNPISKYSLSGADKALKSTDKWNIH